MIVMFPVQAHTKTCEYIKIENSIMKLICFAEMISDISKSQSIPIDSIPQHQHRRYLQSCDQKDYQYPIPKISLNKTHKLFFIPFTFH